MKLLTPKELTELSKKGAHQIRLTITDIENSFVKKQHTDIWNKNLWNLKTLLKAVMINNRVVDVYSKLKDKISQDLRSIEIAGGFDFGSCNEVYKEESEGSQHKLTLTLGIDTEHIWKTSRSRICQDVTIDKVGVYYERGETWYTDKNEVVFKFSL